MKKKKKKLQKKMKETNKIFEKEKLMKQYFQRISNGFKTHLRRKEKIKQSTR